MPASAGMTKEPAFAGMTRRHEDGVFGHRRDRNVNISRVTLKIKDCPICKHPMSKHDEKGACTVENCWCLYNPDQEFGEP